MPLSTITFHTLMCLYELIFGHNLSDSITTHRFNWYLLTIVDSQGTGLTCRRLHQSDKPYPRLCGVNIELPLWNPTHTHDRCVNFTFSDRLATFFIFC